MVTPPDNCLLLRQFRFYDLFEFSMSELAKHRRATPLEVAEQRRLRGIANPFTKDIAKWQAQLAFYRQCRSARKASIEDAVTISAELRELLGRAQAAEQRFAEATLGQPRAGAVEDAAKAFARLIEQISQELSF